ncbi:MAG: hypothetical protein MUC76_01355 [Spirochaetes bacterium]|jgi:hypothetical protein|nr:hypothetical protein [Spirochaetota bacterium]
MRKQLWPVSCAAPPAPGRSCVTIKRYAPIAGRNDIAEKVNRLNQKVDYQSNVNLPSTDKDTDGEGIWRGILTA